MPRRRSPQTRPARRTLLDAGYPGLWWVKAQIFEKLGNRQAAKSAMARAQQGDEELERDR